ncbi:MAG: undecaprenyl diphosphate synthase [Candidatus Argoarchaeum ethanivorans]|uniref:Undecaprenyl diphosphate synthase n=1 Tax=Candidatus Argoarchaeum ethanivorans TaxID=2608793 RepID=A0A8B3RYU3_9EURY|nr:MAG: undecaprenyl diphosphate synthase [Candidatus Argoarchaeum ethanivorans]
MQVVQQLYEQRLLALINKSAVPRHVVLVLDESDVLSNDASKFTHFANWCIEVNIAILTVFISIIEESATEIIGKQLVEQIQKALCPVTSNIRIYCREKDTNIELGDGFCINLAVGYSGRFELTNTIKKIMHKVERGELSAENIDEAVIEQHLSIQCEPDLVIRSGGKRLTDFLIWQSVYSEFYFTDANWQNYRKVDFLRAIRDYQKRQRRYGK